MNHDYAHCWDYDKDACPKNCFRAMLTDDLKNWPYPVTYAKFKGTADCPLTNPQPRLTNYDLLMQLMAAGYTPTKEDYNAAGLSEAQGEALHSQFIPSEEPEPQYVYINRNTGNTKPGKTTPAKEETSGAGVPTAQYNGIMQTIRTAGSATEAYNKLAGSSVYNQLNEQQKAAIANALKQKG